MDSFDKEIDNIKRQYNKHYLCLINYFVENKRCYFKEGIYNYNLIPLDIRSNSFIQRYNKEIKDILGDKKETNLIYFLGFINSEIIRIKNKLITEHNKNVRFNAKKRKFKEYKYNQRNIKNKTPIDIFKNSIYNKSSNININKNHK